MDSYRDYYKAVLYHNWETEFCSHMDLGVSPEFSMSCMVISLYINFLICEMGIKRDLLHLVVKLKGDLMHLCCLEDIKASINGSHYYWFISRGRMALWNFFQVYNYMPLPTSPRSLTLDAGSECIIAGKKKNPRELVKDAPPSLPRENEGFYGYVHHQRQLPAAGSK